MKKAWRAGGAFLVLLSVLWTGGCGRTAVHEALNDREQITIRIAWWGGDERHEMTGKALELYTEAHPEVSFEILSFTWDDYFEWISLETAKGNMPDLIQMDYQYINTYAQNGSLADLTAFVEGGIIRTEEMDRDILDSGRVEGKLRGVATGTSLLSMVYNPAVFDEAGISYPEPDWTWADFSDICRKIKERTGKYGVAMTPVLDMNLYQYWLRQHGERLFSQDGRTLGYEDDALYVEYLALFKELMDMGAAPASESWAALNAGGMEQLPVVTGECGMMQEWNNFAVKVSHVNPGLKLVTPPLAEEGEALGLWRKPGMFWSIAETSGVKEECARFIDWILNSREANAILKGERGVPISGKVREGLLEDGLLEEAQREMFRFTQEAEALCGSMPPPEPAGVEGINDVFSETANAFFYGVLTGEEAAARFRQRAEEILAGYGE